MLTALLETIRFVHNEISTTVTAKSACSIKFFKDFHSHPRGWGREGRGEVSKTNKIRMKNLSPELSRNAIKDF